MTFTPCDFSGKLSSPSAQLEPDRNVPGRNADLIAKKKTSMKKLDPILENPSDGDAISRRDALRRGGRAALLALAGGTIWSGAASSRAAEAGPANSSNPPPFEIVIAIYPNGTLLDFAGPNEVFQRLQNTRVRFASPAGGPVTLEYGIVFGPTERLADVKSADLILVPGGPDLTAPMKPEVLAEIRRIADQAKFVTSVCTGSLILAATGVLKGKRSACHWACVNLLKEYGAIPDPARVVKDGRFMSGGGVTSGIDFALQVAAELQGPSEAEFAQLMIEYDPAPAFRSGHPRVAPAEILERAEKALPGSMKGLFNLPR